MFGQIIAWGNWTVSCLITGAILIPAFGVSPLFASMYAVGFEGGHGTAAGLSESYAALGYPEYGDIAVSLSLSFQPMRLSYIHVVICLHSVYF